MNLSAVRVAAQHQVATMAVEVLDRPRVMGEHDARQRVAQAREGAIEIAHATPKVFHAG